MIMQLRLDMDYFGRISKFNQERKGKKTVALSDQIWQRKKFKIWISILKRNGKEDYALMDSFARKVGKKCQSLIGGIWSPSL